MAMGGASLSKSPNTTQVAGVCWCLKKSCMEKAVRPLQFNPLLSFVQSYCVINIKIKIDHRSSQICRCRAALHLNDMERRACCINVGQLEVHQRWWLLLMRRQGRYLTGFSCSHCCVSCFCSAMSRNLWHCSKITALDK